MKITTKHPNIGYTENVEIIKDALRNQFGIADNSNVLTAIAAHIWSIVCHLEEKRWGRDEIVEAVDRVKARIESIEEQAQGLPADGK